MSYVYNLCFFLGGDMLKMCVYCYLESNKFLMSLEVIKKVKMNTLPYKVIDFMIYILEHIMEIIF